MDHLGIWRWMVHDGGEVSAAGTRLQQVAIAIGNEQDRLGRTLGSAATALGWQGQIVDRAERPTASSQTLMSRLAEDLQAAGTALRDLGGAMDENAPELRRVRVDWDHLQANKPMRPAAAPFGGPGEVVDRPELHRREEELRQRARRHTDALSTADGTCQGLLAAAAQSVRGLVPPGTSPDFLRSLIPSEAYGVFAHHGVADDDRERALAGEILSKCRTAESVRELLAEVPAERLEEFLARHPEVASVLANDWDPTNPSDPVLARLLKDRGDLGPHGQAPDGVAAVAAYWAHLSPQEKERMRLLYPTLIGNTDGIPLPDRAIANRALIVDALRMELAVEAILSAGPTTLEDREQKLAELDRIWFLPNDFQERRFRQAWDALRSEGGQLVRRTTHKDLLLNESRQRIQLYEEMLFGRPVVRRPSLPGLPSTDRMVILFDPREDGRFAVYTGKLDAVNVAVIVPGTGTDMAGMLEYNQRFARLAVQHPDTAVITWLGGDMPDAVVADAPDNSYTRDNGRRLVTFVEGLGVLEDQRVTLAGHSAGGAVVGFADAFGVRTDAVMHIASAGTGPGIFDASMYPVEAWNGEARDVQRFSQTAPGDAIKIAQVSGDLDDALRDADWPTLLPHIGHGYNPDTTPGFTVLDTGVWLEDGEARGRSFRAGDRLDGLESHDHVIRPGTTSWENLLGVVVADWDRVVER